MSDPIKLLIDLYELYSEGKLQSYFNKTTNKMENIPELIAIMEDVHEVVPVKKKPLEAAKHNRELAEVAVTEAIEASEGKVVDLRAVFAKKIAKNGGLQGMASALVAALENGDQETLQEALKSITTLVKYNDGEMPEEV